MSNIITTKEIKEEITLIPTTDYAYIEIHTTIKGITVYNGSIWGVQQLTLNENGTLDAQVNNDPLAIILHNVRDIQIFNNTINTTQYKVNIEYAI